MPFTIITAGSVQADPSPSSNVDGSALMSQSIDLGSTETYDGLFGGNMPIAGSLTFQLGAIAKVRYVAVRAVDGESLTVTIVSGRGTAVIPVSDTLVLKAKNAGDEISAVTVAGTGRIEYIIAGNQS